MEANKKFMRVVWLKEFRAWYILKMVGGTDSCTVGNLILEDEVTRLENEGWTVEKN